MGTDDEPWAYDNERPAHDVDVAAFWIDAAPVSNGEYVAFVPWETLKPYLTPEGANIFGGARPKGDDDGQQ